MPPEVPKTPGKLIRWLCKSPLQEFILGDLEEQFFENIELKGYSKARRLYAWQALKFLRPGFLKSIGNQKLNTYTMFYHDIKTSLRLVQREKLYSAINIIGLSTAFTIALLIFWYAGFETSYEDYNPNAPRMARITMDYLDGETLVDQDCETYHLLGPMIKDALPQVEEFVRVYDFDEFVFQTENKSKTFRVTGGTFAVDPSFFELFHYPLISGNQEEVFQNPGEVVFTESTAKKYFGTTDIVGESIHMESHPMKVVGIIRDSPANTHLKVKMLMSYKHAEKTELADRNSPWNSNDTYTYFQLKDGSLMNDFSANMAPYSAKMIADENFENERIISQPMKDIHLYSNKSFEPEKNGDGTTVLFLIGIAIMVILIALVNYVNLSTTKSLDRAKEVGVRKVLGSSVGQLRLRFMTESLVINFLSISMTILLVMLAQGPFKTISGLPVDLEIFNQASFWLGVTALFVVSVLLAGSIPAVILARLKTINSLRGKYAHSEKGGMLRRGLVIFQFGIALFLLVQTFIANEQLLFLRGMDKGAEFDQVLVVRTPIGEEMKKLDIFKDRLSNQSFVRSAALSNCVPGMPTSLMGSTTGLHIVGTEQHNFNFYIIFQDTAYFKTMQMEIVAGRDFIQIDSFKNSVIVNEESVRLWGISDNSDVIGKQLNIWGRQPTIVGVVKNFHQTNIKDNYIPMVFGPNGSQWGDYLSIKIQTKNVSDQIELLERQFAEVFPNSPFDFFFLDQEFDKEYQADEQFRKVLAGLSIFSLIITCLGLFGLASFTVAKRTKEIGIRKVLGASVTQIVQLISKDFLILIGIGIGLATPVTFFLVKNWLEQYAFRIDLNPVFFVFPAIAIIFIALITVWAKTFKVSISDPIHSLRDE